MNQGTKLALIAVLSVVLAGISVVLIPMPYGAILAACIGVGDGLYMRSLFSNIKE